MSQDLLIYLINDFFLKIVKRINKLEIILYPLNDFFLNDKKSIFDYYIFTYLIKKTEPNRTELSAHSSVTVLGLPPDLNEPLKQNKTRRSAALNQKHRRKINNCQAAQTTKKKQN